MNYTPKQPKNEVENKKNFKKFDKQWKKWVNVNMSLGCNKDEIFNILLNHNFQHDDICSVMNYTPNQNDIKHDTITQETSKNFLENPLFVKIDSSLLEIYKIDNFLNDEECDNIINIINTSSLLKSTTTLEVDSKFRTSSTCHFDMSNSIISYIDTKIHDIMKISKSKGENLQGQKYLIGEEFKTHSDYFSKNQEYNINHLQNGGQRTWTFMVYLNNVEEGGDTEFTEINTKIKPIRGMALLWNNLNDDNTENVYSLHRGLPIIKGEKYIITKWIREKNRT